MGGWLAPWKVVSLVKVVESASCVEVEVPAVGEDVG